MAEFEENGARLLDHAAAEVGVQAAGKTPGEGSVSNGDCGMCEDNMVGQGCGGVEAPVEPDNKADMPRRSSIIKVGRNMEVSLYLSSIKHFFPHHFPR